jgi:hypothetical protein
MAKRATFTPPPLHRVCKAWPAPWEWGQPLSDGMERLRSLGVARLVVRPGGKSTVTVFQAGNPTTRTLRGGVEGVRGVVLGSTAPPLPSAGEVLRGGPSLCARGVALRLDDGRRVVLGATRLREVNRTPRALDPGLTVPAFVAAEMAREARAALDVGDVAGSDRARGETLPFPHRAGSSPCSGSMRPATLLEDLRQWREGDGFESASEGEMFARLVSVIPKAQRAAVPSLAAAAAALGEVERGCVRTWEDWAERNAQRQGELFAAQRRAVREMYAAPSKRRRRAA